MARFVVLLVALIVVAGSFSLAFAGCGTTDVWLFDCKNPDHGHLGPDGGPDPCHYDDDAGADESPPPPPEEPQECADGTCVRWPLPWQPPLWLWVGPYGSEPLCPSGRAGDDAHAELVAPSGCEPCGCEPSIGSCALPSVLTASTVACDQPGGTLISFDAPASWDGTCDATTQVPLGATSLSIAPLSKEEGCAPSLARVPALVPEAVPYHWNRSARLCHGESWGLCGDARTACIPDDEPSLLAGFRLCIFHEGDLPCPPIDGWPEKHLFYGGVEDHRQCTECTCGPPMGSMCTAQISSYTDAACSVPVGPGYTITSAKPQCVEFRAPGQALGSKSATPPTYIPGACQPMGGEPMDGGTAEATNAMTFCCKP